MRKPRRFSHVPIFLDRQPDSAELPTDRRDSLPLRRSAPQFSSLAALLLLLLAALLAYSLM